jgi:serine/threonine-protein kinase
MRQDAFPEAETVARAEYEHSGDPHAFLIMVRAAYLDHRLFDVLQARESAPEMLSNETSVQDDSQSLALEAYLQTEKVHEAARMVNQCIGRHGGRPGLLLRKASVLGLMAKYEEARDVLLQLNRRLPGRPAVLRRLVTVFEQMRDNDSAAAFRRALRNANSGSNGDA